MVVWEGNSGASVQRKVVCRNLATFPILRVALGRRAGLRGTVEPCGTGDRGP
ncbi:hypothetical protein PLANPX_0914 [Lacipirellula parvula]|uniref:Uncharacterized protein n=1 Tax=Lacipirellula parvula TaxID=2650471 RepID=A0A5K7X660_9BACT|nr:hypothetical protein PLANPX_0914 [Lacipirellula parvula]